MSTGAGASDLLHAEDSGLDEIVRGEQAVAARSPMQLFWRRFRRDRVAMVALIFIVLLILVAIFAGPISRLLGAPDPNAQSTDALDDFGLPSGPSSDHLFGVDTIGRDVFARVLYGAQVSLTVAFIGTGLSVDLRGHPWDHRRLLPGLGGHDHRALARHHARVPRAPARRSAWPPRARAPTAARAGCSSPACRS